MRTFFNLIAVVLSLSGCAATGSLEETIGPAIDLRQFSQVRVVIDAATDEQRDIVDLLEAKLIAQLARSGSFEKVWSARAADSEQADLSMRVKLVDLNRVSSEQRALWGGLVGRGAVVLDVLLLNNANDQTVGGFQASGKSSGGTSFSGTTTQAIDQAVAQIIRYIQARR
ncbi:MAG: DUF4410 domain-containing protein [Granulosicoccus sp.]|nr:DUF4410 domain-containing protein [Granulosicoccus sp.]